MGTDGPDLDRAIGKGLWNQVTFEQRHADM